MRKFLYLFLALLVPALVFVFLKYAGSNRFEVPVYPLANAPLKSACSGDVVGPYAIPDSAWRFLPERNFRACVVLFAGNELAAQGLASAIRDEIKGVSFLLGDTLADQPELLARWKSCVFLLEPPRQGVLLDREGRIRGQYDLRSLDETDRLRVELKILTESY